MSTYMYMPKQSAFHPEQFNKYLGKNQLHFYTLTKKLKKRNFKKQFNSQ